ncbi:thioredoxin domain-containing protein 15 [Carettochelys insculpta]|uniref:thioredoxin domain-containing protein 15 n=1 Tax=Carettochelys insculpta TaxID=44489 RepID=UPI003EB74854
MRRLPSPAGELRQLLWVTWLSGSLLAGAVAEENAELESETTLHADGGSAFVRTGEPQEPVQYKTAEIADAMLGSGSPADQSVVLPVIPGEVKDRPISELGIGTCDAGAEDAKCSLGTSLASHLLQPSSHVREQAGESNVVPEAVPVSSPEESNSTDSMKSPKVNCEERNITGIRNFTLQILNISQDLMEFLNPNSSDCTLVLFYTPWCRFSANLAPHFNSLPRVFPTLHFLALDASQHSSLSTRFGTVAVPNILLFQGAKPMARFNHTDRTLETLTAFIFNQTGIEAKKDVVVTEEDRAGPLPSVLTKGIDWLLLFSLLFLASFVMYATIRTESIRWLIPGQEQEHQE